MAGKEREKRKSLLERNKYYATTSVEGFGYIQESNRKIETVFWYIIIVIFLTFTIKNVISLTGQYLEYSTSTDVGIEKLPPFYNISSIEMRIRIGLPLISDFSNIELELSQFKSRDDFLKKNWPYTFVSLLARYAIFMGTCEIHNDKCMKETVYYNQRLLVRDQTNTLLNHSRSVGISDREMMQLFGRSLLVWLNFYVNDPSFTYLVTNQADEESCPYEIKFLNIIAAYGTHESVIAFYQFSRKKPIPIAELKPAVFTIQASMAKINTMVRLKKLKEENIEPRIQIVYGQEGLRRLSTESSASNTDNTDWITKVVFTYVEIKNCIEDRFEWISTCMFESIMKACDCKPLFILNTKNTTKRSCTDKDYNNCFATKKANIRKHCARISLPQCKRDFYEVEFVSNRARYRDQMSIRVSFVNTERPVFVEEYSQTFESFLAELGGTFDFWIGASVIGAIHLILYFCKQCCYATNKETKTGRNVHSIFERLRRKQSMHTLMTTMTTLSSGVTSLYQLPSGTQENQQELIDYIQKLERRIEVLEEKRKPSY